MSGALLALVSGARSVFAGTLDLTYSVRSDWPLPTLKLMPRCEKSKPTQKTCMSIRVDRHTVSTLARLGLGPKRKNSMPRYHMGMLTSKS